MLAVMSKAYHLLFTIHINKVLSCKTVDNIVSIYSSFFNYLQCMLCITLFMANIKYQINSMKREDFYQLGLYITQSKDYL